MTCVSVWSTRASPFCLQRTWLTFSGSWVSSTGQVARTTFGKCGAPCGKFPTCLSQTKSLRIFPSVAARYPCAALFVWLVASSSPSWDLGVGSVFARTLGSVAMTAMRLGGCSPLAGPSCRRNSVCSELPASRSRTSSPRPSGGLSSRLSLIASTIEQVRGSTKCSPPAAAGSKAKPFGRTPLLMCPAEAVFLDPVDRSQRALAAWVLHVAASPPEVPMPHACVFCGTLVAVGDPAAACQNCRARSARVERLVSESSSDS